MKPKWSEDLAAISMKKVLFLFIVVALAAGCLVLSDRGRAARVEAGSDEGSRIAAFAERPAPGGDLRGEVTVNIDFGKRLGAVRHVGVGFLSSIDIKDNPADGRITPLKPKLWRDWRFWVDGHVGTELYRRLARLAQVVQFDMANSWLDTQKFLPCKNWDAWSAHVSRVARDFKRAGINVEWLVWGEPDNGSFFGRNKCEPRDFLTLYELAFRAIRSEFPNAPVGGPGLANANPDSWQTTKRGMAMLFDHCLAKGCELNFVSWHEYVDENVTAVSDHLVEIRRIISDPKYERLKIRKIYIGEVVGGAAMYSPGHAVVVFAELESGGADGSAKACWPVPGPGECDFNSLDGLLTENSEPRSVWWVFRAYAEQAGDWVAAQSSDPAIAVLASADDKRGRIHILAGFSGFVGSSSRPKRVTFKLSNMGRATGLAQIVKIPDTKKAALAKPERISRNRVSIKNGSANFTIPEFRPNDAYYLVLESEHPSSGQ